MSNKELFKLIEKVVKKVERRQKALSTRAAWQDYTEISFFLELVSISLQSFITKPKPRSYLTDDLSTSSNFLFKESACCRNNRWPLLALLFQQLFHKTYSVQHSANHYFSFACKSHQCSSVNYEWFYHVMPNFSKIIAINLPLFCTPVLTTHSS